EEGWGGGLGGGLGGGWEVGWEGLGRAGRWTWGRTGGGWEVGWEDWGGLGEAGWWAGRWAGRWSWGREEGEKGPEGVAREGLLRGRVVDWHQADVAAKAPQTQRRLWKAEGLLSHPESALAG
ncbi:hypothetical protein CYMTET_32822, partial [Cymbomonas tetramitiformis]